MKEKDITPKVIKLSKEIAEHWRMEIYEGCWIIDESLDGTQEYPSLITFPQDIGNLAPIPSISDCLEKLDDLGFMWNFQRNDKGTYEFHIYPLPSWIVPKYRKNYFEAKTKHLVVLSALLEVLKGAK